MRGLSGMMAAAALISAGAAGAQVRVEVNLPVPVVRFQAPPHVVVVEPGIQVVEDSDEEVFFSGGAYWVRRDDRWYRSADHRGVWVIAPPPPRLVTFKPGAYRHYHHVENREKHRDHRH